MKKVLMIVLAVLISVAFVTTVFAQEKKGRAYSKDAPAAVPAPAESRSKSGSKERSRQKPRNLRVTFVKSQMTKAKTLVAKETRVKVTFDVATKIKPKQQQATK